jgi:hypothetical protein
MCNPFSKNKLRHQESQKQLADILYRLKTLETELNRFTKPDPFDTQKGVPTILGQLNSIHGQLLGVESSYLYDLTVALYRHFNLAPKTEFVPDQGYLPPQPPVHKIIKAYPVKAPPKEK